MKGLVASWLKKMLGRPEAIKPSELSRILEDLMQGSVSSSFAGRLCWRQGNVLLIDPYKATLPEQDLEAEIEAPETGSVDYSETAARFEDWDLTNSDEIPGILAQPPRDDVEFDVATGKVEWGMSTLPWLIKSIAQEFPDEPFRAIMALPEKRQGTLFTVGHYTTLVIDRHRDGRISATVLDSQAMSGLKSFSLVSLMRHQHLNPDRAIHEMLQFHFKTEVEYERVKYNHQAEVLDTSCGYFTAKMVKEVYSQSIMLGGLEQPVTDMFAGGRIAARIAERWGIALISLVDFLSPDEVSRMQKIIARDDEVAQGAPTVVAADPVAEESASIQVPQRALTADPVAGEGAGIQIQAGEGEQDVLPGGRPK